ncbi:hypothetical protein [Pseudooceanicola nanhaiensis]
MNFIVSAALAAAAVYIAVTANRISSRSVRVEADKHVFEWGQRVLACLSAVSALRLTPEAEIGAEEFKRQRRALRSDLFALAEEGKLFFVKSDAEAADANGALLALSEISGCMHGRKYRPPQEMGNDERLRQNSTIRSHTRAFIRSVQDHVGSEWIH